MKKVFILLIGLFAFGWQAQGMTGSGTATDPFLISTYEDLKLIKNSISSVYRIVADIDASASVLDNDGAGFEPIGTFSTTPFSGTLSAGGHTIRNLTINRSGQDFVGLFGYLNGSATVDSLALVGVNISGKSYVGALAGISAAKITNCFSSGSVTGTGQYIGGLVGDNYSSSCSIAYSYSTCSVTGDSSVGGLAGFNVKTVSNCYASGPVSGNSSVGGLVGQLYGSSSVVNSYSVGLVTGNTNVGGLVGINNGTVTNSYWNWETSGQTTSKGGTKKSTDEMKLQSTYTNWDFSTIWTMTENQTYPGLRKLNNIPFVLDDDFIIDVKSFDLSNLLLNDFDIETDVADLTMKILSCTTGSIIGNTLVFPEDSIAGTKSVIVYRLGEILATDTLWGNIATATITLNLKGGGSPDNPYLIHTYEELKKIASVSLSAHYRLVADIDASASATENSGSGFQPIGNYSGTPFTGKLNGSGHIISRLSIKRTEQNYIGLFGYLGNESVVDSLGLINADISGKGYVGALVGINDGNVFGCFSTGAVDGSGNYVGGMSGNNNAGKVAFSYSDCSVSGALLVGGLVGYNNDSISNCYATGTVNCTFDKIGGLIGYNDVLGVVTDSYSIGTISGGVQQGGLIGSNNSGTITNSYWNIETSGIVVSAGGTGLNTAQMKLQSSFEDWDFDESWDIVDNVSYPYSRKVNNASIAVNDSLICGYKFDLLRLLENDFDVETGKEKLVFRILSHSTGSITDSTLILPETNEVGIACTLVYRIGEVLAGDTLWGNKATAVLIRNIEGLGTEENPFILKTYEDLRNIADVSLSSVYRIVNDIDASASTTDNNGSGFEPVGNYNPSTPFTGKLHGGGHIISNLTINRSGFNFIGIFSYLGAGSLVDSLGLTNVYVRGKGYVGAFVGINDGTLINCYSIGSVIGSSDYIGGLVGDNYTYGNVTSCYSECSVTGNSSVGGLVGYNGKTITKSQASGNVAGYKNVGGLTGVNHYGSTVSYSSATGIVTGKSGAENIGGLVGNNESATISYCYATGNVNNPGSIIDNDGFGFSVGGLAGYNGGNISNCYAIGSVNTGDCYYVGGLIGENKDGSVNYCYFAGGINKSNSSGGGIFGVSWTPVNPTSFFNTAVIGETSSEIGASGKITSEMVLQSTFSGWNFNTIWTIDEGKSYPYLRNNIPDSLPTPPTLTITGTFTVSDKIYDETDSATIIYNDISLNGVIGNDIVDLNVVATFADAELGENKTVNLIKSTISGADADKYILSFIGVPTTTAGIKIGLNISGTFSVEDKVYDGTVDATIRNNDLLLIGTVDEDVVLLNAVASFDDTNAGEGKNVHLKNSSLTGTNAGKYMVLFTDAPTTTATIEKADVLAPDAPQLSDKSTSSIILVLNELLEFSIDGGANWQDSVNFVGLLPATAYNIFARVKETANYKASPASEALQVTTNMNGSGTMEDPYLIPTYTALKIVKENLSAYYKVICDIDASASKTENEEAGFEPIGNDAFMSFSGNFNGGGYVISNLYINKTEDSNPTGMFGRVDFGAVIDSVGLLNATIQGSSMTGGLAGINYGTISHSYVTGEVSGTSYSTGGLVGINYSTILKAYSSAVVHGNFFAGGLVGCNDGGNISNCYACGYVSSESSTSAGLVGEHRNGSIVNCYSMCKVNEVSAQNGLIALSSGTASNSYWDIQTSGQSASADGIGKSTIEMLSQSTFTDWDFTSTWTMVENKTYPGLRGLNNAPFAFNDALLSGKTFALSNLLLNDYDIEAGTSKLTLKVLNYSAGTLTDDALIFPEDTEDGTIVNVEYRVGEVLETDTLWGSIAKATITFTTPTAISDTYEGLFLNVYPNPVRDILHVEVSDNKLPLIKIYNLQGIAVMENKGVEINMSDLLEGIYIVDVDGTRIRVIKKQ